MAHTKAGGKVSQKINRPGRRLGIKISDGGKIKPGQIIIRQRGSEVHAGENVKKGRDFTLYATASGIIKFTKREARQFVNVLTK